MDVIQHMDHDGERSGDNALPVVTDKDGNRKRNGIWLLTHPRSASNLFQTMLAKQSNFRHSGYWFFGANMAALPHLSEGKWEDLPEEMREKFLGMYQDGYDGMMDDFQSAKDEGKEVLVKEHAVLMYGPEFFFRAAYGGEENLKFKVRSDNNPNPKHTNPTCLPDDVLLSMQPVFQIRHPGLMFPSLARAENDVAMGSGPLDVRCYPFNRLVFSRRLYEWYTNQPNAPTPKIISADDIMNEPEVVRQLCVEVDMNPDELQYEWETREAPADKKEQQRFASTIYASKGILPGYDSKSFDLEKERAKWRDEWGVEGGDALAKQVQDAMPDYEWLMERRVQALRN